MGDVPLWISDPSEMRELVRSAQRAGASVGLVPTMGNLHAGHTSLINAARGETDRVAVTIFVNPLQFCPGEDLDRYPRTPEQDRELCRQAGADWIFAPKVETMYPPGATTQVQVLEIEEPLCGQHRPGHFVGVATVVTKLFNLVPADVAYFGLKDYQQAKLIERLARDLYFPIRIRFCPTIREPDGLAMSSRNSFLTTEERQRALVLKQALDMAALLVAEGERNPGLIREKMLARIEAAEGVRVDYVELVEAASLRPIERIVGPTLAAIAVRLGTTRLIDNCVLTP